MPLRTVGTPWPGSPVSAMLAALTASSSGEHSHHG
jgi:hypothetical protein